MFNSVFRDQGALLSYGIVLALFVGAATAEELPAIGDKAADFTLKNLEGTDVSLSEMIAKGPVVLVVLRGYPGYQCPICSLQAGEFLSKAKKFQSAGANVLFVYPGPADNLDEYAKEFMGKRVVPDQFELLLDPDYDFTNSYRLRWNEPRETAYPSTFVIDKEGVIRFAKISKSHAGRTRAKDVLDEVEGLSP